MFDLISKNRVLSGLMNIKKLAAMYLLDGKVSKKTHDSAVVMADLFAELIEKTPTIDAVSVVQCKDCKHRCMAECPMHHTETYSDGDEFEEDYDVDNTDDDGFCHLGERRDKNADDYSGWR